MNKELFWDWYNDGNVCNLGNGKFLEQTTQWCVEFSWIGLVRFYKREFIL